MVNITLRVLSKPDPNALPFIYRRLGTDYDERVLPSIVNEVTKAVVAKYNASELLTKRESVSKAVSLCWPFSLSLYIYICIPPPCRELLAKL